MVSAGAPGSWACWQVQTSPAPAVGPWRESGLLGHLLHQLVRVPRGVTQRRRRPGSGASDGSLVKSNPFIYPTLLLAGQPREEEGEGLVKGETETMRNRCFIHIPHSGVHSNFR